MKGRKRGYHFVKKRVIIKRGVLDTLSKYKNIYIYILTDSIT